MPIKRALIWVNFFLSGTYTYKQSASSRGALDLKLKKKAFANDRHNHVPSCGRVNSSKGSAVPKDFLRRSNDGKGLYYKIVRWCEYVTKYHSVKLAYQLTTSNNDQKLLASCSKSRSNTG